MPAPPVGLPAPTMLSVLAAVTIAELEDEFPGLVDRLITRLGSAALRSDVVRIRGERALPELVQAQDAALLWLTAIRPLMGDGRKRRRR